MRQVDHRAGDLLLFFIRVDRGDKGPVDLDPVHTEPLQRRDGGVAGAKVIKVDMKSGARQAGDVLGDVVAFFLHQDRF